MENKKQLVYTLLFCLYIRFLYLNLADWAVSNFYALCDRHGILVSVFQEWLFLVISFVYYFAVMALIVGLFAYWFRHFRLWLYVVAGIFVRYVFEINFLLSFDVNRFFYYFIDLAIVCLAAYVAGKYVKNFNYLDSKDKISFTLWGLPKVFWVLIATVFNPVVSFLSRYLVLALYEASKSRNWLSSLLNIFNMDYSGNLLKLFMLPLASCMFLAISVYLFYVAVKAAKNKSTPYRKAKLIGILGVFPGLVILAQIMISYAVNKKIWWFS